MSQADQIKHFLDLPSVPTEELKKIISEAHEMKAGKYRPPQIFSGLTLAMLFDKPSTRTRMSFEVAMKQLGGHTIQFDKEVSQMGRSETISDTSKVLSRYVDAVMIRMSDHQALHEFASVSSVPVISGMTDFSHPCQIMADIMTIEEQFGGTQGLKIAWFGDYNNVSRTLAQAADIWDFEFVMAVPSDLHPSDETFKNAHLTDDPKEAAKNASVLITDTWTSMGQEGKDTEIFHPYQVNRDLFDLARDEAVFMHCMPLYRDKEVSAEIADSPRSIIFDEAENRLHAQKAILAWCLRNTNVFIG